MDLERTTPFIHRSQLSGEILTEEKRRLWQGPVHQVATKAHEIRVDDPRPSEQMCSKILSNISGGRVTEPSDLVGWILGVTARQIREGKEGTEGG